ncbi:DUF697 domain-containing protein [Synechococcus sp. RSCCF101]|uniref:YcjF family protein n=1 Tax=Synechococcus sp. RSCCF101 TaxID=2511069 RepID=UPI0012440BD1|nr:YcjF family protein [Synechococcus sp. RSCCF101]QEY31426.1 DUF697 domain-containing protein [Synechococcus sp. RSCCF101]
MDLCVRHWQPLALAGGGLLIGDWLLQQLLPASGGGLSLVALAGGVWLWRRPKPAAGRPGRAGDGLEPLTERCRASLSQLETLEQELGGAPVRADGQPAQTRQRRDALEQLLGRHGRAGLELAVVGTQDFPADGLARLQTQLSGAVGLTLHRARPLTSRDPSHRWPADLIRCDGLLYAITLPLTAADRCWLQALPEEMPVWLLLRSDLAATRSALSREGGAEEVQAQLPQGRSWTLLDVWTGGGADAGGTGPALAEVRASLMEQPRQRIRRTEGRLLRHLDHQWQCELERLRRERCRDLVQTTQWAVAAAVVASPVPAVDLLAATVANGLMLKEMATLWQCSWSLDQLKEAAAELGKAALALGVVEWSSEALLGLAKLDGTSWLVAGAMQGLSAAYLTRVVGRSMADLLARSQGLSGDDLERLRREAPLLVARAADSERLDWAGFLEQARRWSTGQTATANGM